MFGCARARFSFLFHRSPACVELIRLHVGGKTTVNDVVYAGTFERALDAVRMFEPRCVFAWSVDAGKHDAVDRLRWIAHRHVEHNDTFACVAGYFPERRHL